MKPRRFGPVARAGDIPLKPEEYRLIRDLVSERLGLFFGPELRSSLERRLRERLGVRGLASFADYYQLLKYSPLGAEEWDEAAEILTTHETYFFREDYQLRAFQQEILPVLAKKERKRIQIWSAGCSTGEEAYTIAMLILDSGLFEPLADWEIRVHGSDLSKKCIAAARRGIYGNASFRTTSDDLRGRWFVPSLAEEGKSGVAAAARSLCHFAQMNLLDEERTHLVGKCDVIFCRNVVLYFDAAARKRVIDMFYEQLVPGGVLLLGHAESLLNVSTAFELLHLKEDLVYKSPPPPAPNESLRMTAPPIRLMVVDDSAYNRRTIQEVFQNHPEVEIVGKAADGEEALRMATMLKPDVITLDLEMPRMDGFTFLRILMAKQATPVIVVSSYAQKENVFKALELGALDFVAKPTAQIAPDAADLRQQILEKVLVVRQLRASAFGSGGAGPSSGPISRKPASLSGYPDRQSSPESVALRASAPYVLPKTVVAIASSTGGPSALLEIFGKIPRNTTAGFVVAQHMPDKFTRTFAERLDRKGSVRTSEAQDGDRVGKSTGFVCPGRQCMELQQNGAELKLVVGAAKPDDKYVPSADRLLKSVAATMGHRAVGVILTGMGDDGVEGARAIRDAGGIVVAESQETAVVYGMPGAAVRAGIPQKVLPLPQIAEYLASFT